MALTPRSLPLFTSGVIAGAGLILLYNILAALRLSFNQPNIRSMILYCRYLWRSNISAMPLRTASMLSSRVGQFSISADKPGVVAVICLAARDERTSLPYCLMHLWPAAQTTAGSL